MSNQTQTKRKAKNRSIIEFSIYMLLSGVVIYLSDISWWFLLLFAVGYFLTAFIILALFLLWRSKMKKKYKDWFVDETKNK